MGWTAEVTKAASGGESDIQGGAGRTRSTWDAWFSSSSDVEGAFDDGDHLTVHGGTAGPSPCLEGDSSRRRRTRCP